MSAWQPIPAQVGSNRRCSDLDASALHDDDDECTQGLQGHWLPWFRLAMEYIHPRGARHARL
eukprot:7052598-Prymnesium_polylepis.1